MADQTPLGYRVIAALTAAGFVHAADADYTDGFTTHHPADQDSGDHVVVAPHFRGVLSDLAVPGVRIAWAARVVRALDRAGLAAALYPPVGTPSVVVAAADHLAADRAAVAVPRAEPSPS